MRMLTAVYTMERSVGIESNLLNYTWRNKITLGLNLCISNEISSTIHMQSNNIHKVF